jgi:hypothetical protein
LVALCTSVLPFLGTGRALVGVIALAGSWPDGTHRCDISERRRAVLGDSPRVGDDNACRRSRHRCQLLRGGGSRDTGVSHRNALAGNIFDRWHRCFCSSTGSHADVHLAWTFERVTDRIGALPHYPNAPSAAMGSGRLRRKTLCGATGIALGRPRAVAHRVAAHPRSAPPFHVATPRIRTGWSKWQCSADAGPRRHPRGRRGRCRRNP